MVRLWLIAVLRISAMSGLEIDTSKPQIHEAVATCAACSGKCERQGKGPLTMQNVMIEKPQLLIKPWIKPWNIGEPFIYKCSQCGQEFLPPEDRNSDEAIAEVSHPSMNMSGKSTARTGGEIHEVLRVQWGHPPPRKND